MNLSADALISIIIYIIGFACTTGAVLTRIKFLETKVEKHNNLIERMYRVEECTKQAHQRIDELKGGFG